MLVDGPAFAEMIAESLDDGVKPGNSYRITLERGFRWTTIGEQVPWSVLAQQSTESQRELPLGCGSAR